MLSFCVCYLPLFSIGLVMGGAAIPSNAPDALWESNVWVLLIAIFAYDIRDSVYAIRGLAVGLMFEAMCIGQLIARVSTLSFSSCALAVAGALTAGEAMPSEMLAYCRKLALENGLTPREAEILGLIAMGRSAKYIAEELTISHNTTRTHIKHVYEKLNIHSKQELLDLVLFGSGLM